MPQSITPLLFLVRQSSSADARIYLVTDFGLGVCGSHAGTSSYHSITSFLDTCITLHSGPARSILFHFSCNFLMKLSAACRCEYDKDKDKDRVFGFQGSFSRVKHKRLVHQVDETANATARSTIWIAEHQ